MATLVAIGYPDQTTAEQARQTVQQLESDLIIQADQVAAITHAAMVRAAGPPPDRVGRPVRARYRAPGTRPRSASGRVRLPRAVRR